MKTESLTYTRKVDTLPPGLGHSSKPGGLNHRGILDIIFSKAFMHKSLKTNIK
jgi:hypothetical protein